jgi:hypothetical protein
MHACSHERSGIAAATASCCCCCAAAAYAGWLLLLLAAAAVAAGSRSWWQLPQNFEWKIPREFLYENPYLNFLRKLYRENSIKNSLGKCYQNIFHFFDIKNGLKNTRSGNRTPSPKHAFGSASVDFLRKHY